MKFIVDDLRFRKKVQIQFKSFTSGERMAPPRISGRKPPKKTLLQEISSKYLTVDFVKSLVIDPARLPWISYLILAAELVLNIFIVLRINYTEIDWVAYMQECEGFLNGTTDYSQLKGKAHACFSFSTLFMLLKKSIFR
jgi:ALG3 protein